MRKKLCWLVMPVPIDLELCYPTKAKMVIADSFCFPSLTDAEKNYSHIEKKALSLVFGMTKFRQYLFGQTFMLLTDHRPIVYLLSSDKLVPVVAAAQIQCWALTWA